MGGETIEMANAHDQHAKDADRVKTARELLEERLAKMKTDESPKAREALKAAAELAPAEGASAGTPAGTGAGTGTGTDDRTANAEKEAAEWKNEALRARADLDNYQKRIRREMDEVRTYAASGVLSDVIAILDSLDWTLEAAKQKPDLDVLVQGVEMVRGQLEKLLQDRGAERIAAANVPFDPRRHEAVLVEERADVPDNTATAELRRGYALRDRVLRCAQVKVSRGAAKPAGGAEQTT